MKKENWFDIKMLAWSYFGAILMFLWGVFGYLNHGTWFPTNSWGFPII